MSTTMRDGVRFAGALTFVLSTMSAFPAHADGPPPTDTVHLTPAEEAPTPVPAPAPAQTASSTSLAENAQPVEFLPVAHPSKVAAFLFAGVAVVGVGVGSTFGALALHNQSLYNASPTAASLHSGNQDGVLADVGLGAAVIAGVTSLVLFLKPDDSSAAPASSPANARPVPTSPRNVSFSPIVGPQGAGLFAVIRF